jgi:hypothetical protein
MMRRIRKTVVFTVSSGALLWVTREIWTPHLSVVSQQWARVAQTSWRFEDVVDRLSLAPDYLSSLLPADWDLTPLQNMSTDLVATCQLMSQQLIHRLEPIWLALPRLAIPRIRIEYNE